jgi:hypothetical protein
VAIRLATAEVTRMYDSLSVAPHPRSTMRSSTPCLAGKCVGAALVPVAARARSEVTATSGDAVCTCSVSPDSSGALMPVSIELNCVMKPGSEL